MQMTRSWQHPASGSLARDAVFDKLFASSIRFGSMNLIGPQSKSLKHFFDASKACASRLQQRKQAETIQR